MASISSAEKFDNEFFDLIASRRTRFAEVPRVIKLSWIAVSKVIVALAQHYESFRNYGEYMYLNCIENKDGTYQPQSEKAKLLADVLLFLGELPLDTSVTYGDGVVGGRQVELQRLKRASNTKEEQLLCLELMVARCWYDLYIKQTSIPKCRYQQYLALEYMYWECSIDHRLSLLWETEPDINDPIYNEGRQILYGGLFAAQQQGLLADKFSFLTQSANNLPALLDTADYQPARQPRPIKRRRINGVLAGFNANSASMRGVRGRPGPISPINLFSTVKLSNLLDHVRDSYPIQV